MTTSALLTLINSFSKCSGQSLSLNATATRLSVRLLREFTIAVPQESPC